MKNESVFVKSIINSKIFLLFSILLLSFIMVGNVSASSYSLTLTSSGSQSIDVSPFTGTAISSDAIEVTTTCRYGYNFTIQTSVDDTTLYLDGNSDSSAYTYFSPAGGFDPLNETENEWGYFYDGNTVPTSASIFSPVPSSLEEPAIIKAPLVTPASSDINDNFNIYYGVSASANAEKGTYKMIPDEHDNDGTIVYTATVAEDCLGYTIQFEPGGQTWIGGDMIIGTGTMSDQVISEDVTTSLSPISYTAPPGYYFAGWNTKVDGTGTVYTDQQQVTNLAVAGERIFLFAMWTDCPGGKICYDANYDSNHMDVEGEMGNQTISNTATSTTLFAPNYKVSTYDVSDGNYAFESWNTLPDGSGIDYGPNQTIEFTAGRYQTGGLKLYAKWAQGLLDMQDWDGCYYMSQGEVQALKDTRDGNMYAVAKLADGKCWMIENLRLADKDANNNDINLSSSNTHNPSLPLTNIYDSGTTSYHLSSTTDPTTTAWCQTDSSACDNQSMLATNNTTLFTNNTASGYSAESNVYSYGNYYNWYSATGGHGKYGSSYGSSYTAPGDICPAGWHLPTGKDATGDFGVLDIALGGTGAYSNPSTTPTGATMSLAYRSYPNNFVYSGYVNGSSVSSRSSSGYYWSSSAGSSNSAYPLFFYSTSVRPGTSYDVKYYGGMVRCVACNYHFGISDCDDVGGGQL